MRKPARAFGLRQTTVEADPDHEGRLTLSSFAATAAAVAGRVHLDNAKRPRREYRVEVAKLSMPPSVAIELEDRCGSRLRARLRNALFGALGLSFPGNPRAAAFQADRSIRWQTRLAGPPPGHRPAFGGSSHAASLAASSPDPRVPAPPRGTGPRRSPPWRPDRARPRCSGRWPTPLRVVERLADR